MEQVWLAGRQVEAERLNRILAGAAGGLVLLGGETGVGKSALLGAVLDPRRTLTGEAAVGGEYKPLGPWWGVITQAAARFGRSPALLPAPLGAGPATLLTPDGAARLHRWLDGGPGPAVVVLDEMHGADPASLELLRLMAPLLPSGRLHLVVTYRTCELHRHHPLWSLVPTLERAGALRLHLRRLTQPDLADWIARELGEVAAPALTPLLYGRTGGHPLYVRQLLRLIRQHGRLPAPCDPLPTSLPAAIEGLLARLSTLGQAALEAAALVGDPCPVALLQAVGDWAEAPLALALAEAEAMELIRVAGGAVRFSHPLVREVATGRVVLPRRQRLHRRVADLLLAGPDPDPDLVACHLQRACDRRAFVFLAQSGDRAVRAGLLVQAQWAYERALDLAPLDHPVQPELLMKLSWVLGTRDRRRAAACREEAGVVPGPCGIIP